MDIMEKQQKNFVGYEYKEIVADSIRASFLLDGYENFGWEFDGKIQEKASRQKMTMHLKRNRKIVNKAELTRLQRNFEACVKEIDALEKAKTSVATMYAMILGMIGMAFIAGGDLCSDGAAAVLCLMYSARHTGIFRLDISLFSL